MRTELGPNRGDKNFAVHRKPCLGSTGVLFIYENGFMGLLASAFTQFSFHTH